MRLFHRHRTPREELERVRLEDAEQRAEELEDRAAAVAEKISAHDLWAGRILGTIHPRAPRER